MREEIIGILIIITVLVAMPIVKRLVMKSSLKKAKAFLKEIEEAELEARFGK